MDNRGKVFLEEIYKEAEQKYKMIIHQLDEQASDLEVILGNYLSVQMENLYPLYCKSSDEPSRHVVISYLRTGWLDRHPMYAIAMYNQELFFSQEECLVMWDVQELSEPLYKMMEEMKEKFKKQTIIEEYYIDEMWLNYGDLLHEWMMMHMPQIVRNHLRNKKWEEFYRTNFMRISAGEYRNQIKRIFEWRE